TSVGKTVASAALMHRYRSVSPRYWKPIQTGIEQDDDTAVVRQLGACSEGELLNDGIRLPGPVSPHLAAKLSHTEIQVEELIRFIENSAAVNWIVEGAGGVLVPLNDSEFMIDLMVRLQLPVLVVSRAELGTINHTLLTLEALRTRALRIAGVVMVGVRNAGNRAAIEHYGNVAVLGEMPELPSLTSESVAHWAGAELDPSGILRNCFQ
ncbi:MAG TPA: dethiobiotin synthase, partial [Terriglobia bacterium]|nr:dethiobiotin synthase [Terriglobia bacterium]